MEIDAFARLMNEKLDTADTDARKSYIHSIGTSHLQGGGIAPKVRPLKFG